MKKIVFLLICSYLFINCNNKGEKFTTKNILFTSDKIAQTNGNNFEFCVDTTMLKKALEQRVLMDKSSLEKIEIKKQKVVSANEEYYFLLGRNLKKHLKLAVWLDKKEDSFYFHQMPKTKDDDLMNKEMFYFTYLTCEGTDNDCFPEVYLEKGEKFWTSTKTPKCGESKCLTSKTVIEE